MCGRWWNTALSGAPAPPRLHAWVPYPDTSQNKLPLISPYPPGSANPRTLLSIGGGTLLTSCTQTRARTPEQIHPTSLCPLRSPDSPELKFPLPQMCCFSGFLHTERCPLYAPLPSSRSGWLLYDPFSTLGSPAARPALVLPTQDVGPAQTCLSLLLASLLASLLALAHPPHARDRTAVCVAPMAPGRETALSPRPELNLPLPLGTCCKVIIMSGFEPSS